LFLYIRETGGGTDNLIADFTSAQITELEGLKGQPCKGAWKLHVFDTAARDVEKLNQ
jgi:subtilisin-like proprotein convertase family protein